MTHYCTGFPLAVGIGLVFSGIVSAGQIAGISRTDGEPLETGPFESHSTSTGPEISHEFQPMYVTTQPNTWTKTFRWAIPANTGLVPSDTLSVMESIPLIYPAGTDPSAELSISDWHELIAPSDLSNFVEWDSQTASTRISARMGSEELPIHPSVSFSPDRKSVWFDFDPVQISTESAMSSVPVTLDSRP